jgi:ubiquinone/menaquinone biosynthesis C-methylase UbiE
MKYSLTRRIKKTYYTLTGKHKYRSETSKVRSLVLPFCAGYGCDIGFGGDKIKKENCVGIDYPTPYTNVGGDKVDIGVDLHKEKIPVADNTYDYVYSSHLIEDFEDTSAILAEHIRILKSGGNLVLAFPDQPTYEAYCKKYYILLNLSHKHKNFGYDFVVNALNKIPGIKSSILFQSNCEIDYNVVLVAKIEKQ